ncbi:site-specific integrase [uncultured Ramlibacter sp.]|uniref:site-specific integrase n=1 Tax=uncultured Ramlibacter sp. TaxID=260755 RepID=UPI0026277088|nr:site-specific integrase [uncultured Ramlibacter sp.]
MKQALPLHIHRRGKRGTLYLRRRIPADVASTYPANKKEHWVSLETTDLKLAMPRLHAEQHRLDQEFERRRALLLARSAERLPSQRTFKTLSDDQIAAIGQQWVHQTLSSDAMEREHGLSDDYYDHLAVELVENRRVFGDWLARGRSEPMIEPMREYLQIIRLDAELSPEQERKVAHTMLKAMVAALDLRIARHRGEVVETKDKAPAPPKHPAAMTGADGPTWEAVYQAWNTRADNRPLSTQKHFKSHWTMLKTYATAHEMAGPSRLTPKGMSDWVNHMAESVSVVTVNTRLANVKTIFKNALGRHVVAENPARDTLPLAVVKRDQGKKAHFPFTQGEVEKIFDSPIFRHLELPRGRTGESAYWMPLILSYTGARAEEIAGMAASEVVHDPEHGWFLLVTDIPDDNTAALYDDDGKRSKRGLKTLVSRRRVPVAQELVDLGLLRYVQHLKDRGEAQLFPELTPGNDGKWSTAFGKYFGRYLRKQGVTDRTKVMNSFRHRMKDLLERARADSKYLKRILGHATGDGSITDGYGEDDLPFGEIAAEFAKVKFPKVSVQPWQPLKKASGSMAS